MTHTLYFGDDDEASPPPPPPTEEDTTRPETELIRESYEPKPEEKKI